MPLEQCGLLSLPDELICEIFSHCTVQDVLYLERTCRTLQQLLQSRPVWISQLESLDIECAPNIPPCLSIDSLSTEEVREKVIQAVSTRQNWTSSDHMRVDHEMELDIPCPEFGRSSNLVEPRVLPGCKELLVVNCGRLELWSIIDKRMIWFIPIFEEYYDCVSFDCELKPGESEGSRQLVIAAVFSGTDALESCKLRVFTYDFEEEAPALAFERKLPNAIVFRVMLYGDFVIESRPWASHTIIFNWKLGQCSKLNFVDSQRNRIEVKAIILVDEYLVALAYLPSGFSAFLLPLSSLEGYWSTHPNFERWETAIIENNPMEKKLQVVDLPYSKPRINLDIGPPETETGPRILAHHVYKPTWRQAAPTEVFIAAWDWARNHQSPPRLLSYRLQLKKNECRTDPSSLSPLQKSLKVLSANFASTPYLPWNARSLSNAGRMFSLREKLRTFCLFTDEEQPVSTMELDLGSDLWPAGSDVSPIISAVEPWSGTIAIGQAGHIKVLFFED